MQDVQTDRTDAAHWVDLALSRARRLTGRTRIAVRFEEQRDHRHVLRPGAARTTSQSAMGGIGLHATHASGTGYAYTNELSADAIEDAVVRAARLAEADHRRHPDAPAPAAANAGRVRQTRPDTDPGGPADADRIHDLLRRAVASAHEGQADARITAAYGVKETEVMLADDQGTDFSLWSSTSSLFLQGVVQEGGRTGDGNSWRGGPLTPSDYETDGGPEAIGEALAHRLVESLVARPVRPGRHRVLADPGLSGLLAHESFGHLTEADLVRAGWSVLAGRIGERLAAHGVTIRDTPLAPDPLTGVRVPYDAEGTTGTDVTMLDDGVLTAYLLDKASSEDLGMAASGNARALNVQHPAIVRMRNTYIEPGALSLDECVEALRDGYYLQGGRGGSPRADGSFMFTAERGYRVESGKIVEPVKMTSIYGNVLDFLANVEGLGNRMEMQTNYFGGCGKWDQSYLHVGTGGPDVLVSEALLGGQQT